MFLRCSSQREAVEREGRIALRRDRKLEKALTGSSLF